MDKNFAKKFTKCPNCGCEERFFESVANELKEKGQMRKEFGFHLDAKQGAITDPVKFEAQLVGSEVVGYAFATDICPECGTIYAVKLERVVGKKTATPIDQRNNKYHFPRFKN